MITDGETNWKQLIGKTITAVQQMKLKKFDDEGFVRLEFADGTHCTLEGSYGGYTGDSEDEYITTIRIADAKREAQLIKLQ